MSGRCSASPLRAISRRQEITLCVARPSETYWVDRLPSTPSAQPQFLAVVSDEEQHALWQGAGDELDVALSKALAAAHSKAGDSAVVYRYLNARGSAGADTTSKCSCLIGGYYELSTPAITSWVSAAEVAAATSVTD